eukprot:6214732-Pleurochrysis_carterae.AAC.2
MSTQPLAMTVWEESQCPNQSLVAHAGSATDYDHNLNAPVVYKASSNVHDNVGQIKGPGVRSQVDPGLFGHGLGILKGAIYGI